MKKILIIISICCAAFGVKAQGNLQYSRVVLVTISWVNSYSSIDTVFSVPAGKVWKIESGIAGNIELPTYSFNLFLDGKLISMSNSDIGDKFPIWLPSGTYTLSGTCNQGPTYPFKGAISVIEYNEVP